jgi:hypothetical protein
MSVCSLLLFCLMPVTPATLAHNAGLQTQVPRSTGVQQVNPGEVPDGLSGSDWSSIQAQIAAGKYRAYQHAEGGYISSNPSQGWQIRYSEDGTTRLTPRNSETSAYRLALQPSSPTESSC